MNAMPTPLSPPTIPCPPASAAGSPRSARRPGRWAVALAAAVLAAAGCNTSGAGRPDGNSGAGSSTARPDGDGSTAPRPAAKGVNIVIASRFTHPRNPEWYQVNVVLVDVGGRIVRPKGDFQVRLSPGTPVDGGPPIVGDILWEEWEPVTRRLPGGWRVEEVPHKQKPGELLDCKALLILPLSQMADVLPNGTATARTTLEFLGPDGRPAGTPETIEIPLATVPNIDRVGLPVPAFPAAKLELVAMVVGDRVTVTATLRTATGAFTLPEGDFRVSAVGVLPGDTSAPAAAESYRNLELDLEPVHIGRRTARRDDRGNDVGHNLEFRSRFAVDKTGVTAAADGHDRAWLRVEFVPADRRSPRLTSVTSVAP